MSEAPTGVAPHSGAASAGLNPDAAVCVRQQLVKHAVDVTDEGRGLLRTLADRRRQAAGQLTGGMSTRDLETLRELLERLSEG